MPEYKTKLSLLMMVWLVFGNAISFFGFLLLFLLLRLFSFGQPVVFIKQMTRVQRENLIFAKQNENKMMIII